MVNSSTTDRPSSELSTSDGKKSVPVTHVILKRVTDLKAMVSELKDSSFGRSPESDQASLLQAQLEQQTAELSSLQRQVETFQSGLLDSIRDTLNDRLAEIVSSSQPGGQATAPSTADPPEAKPNDSSLLARFGMKSRDAEENKQSADKHSPANGAEDEGPPESTWASIRSAFLNDHPVDDETADSNQELAPSTGHETTDPAAGNDQADELREINQFTVLDLPELEELKIVADLDSLSETELRATVEKQERVISALVRRLQTRFINRPTLTTEQLAAVREDVGGELSDSIQETLALLQQQLRQGELDLSFERARLSRRRTELEQLEERIEGRARTLGVTINDDGTIDDVKSAQQTGSKARRWLGAMGLSDD